MLYIYIYIVSDARGYEVDIYMYCISINTIYKNCILIFEIKFPHY